MIGMAVVGAAIGSVLLFLVVLVFPPKRRAIVELGRFYAHYRGPESAVVRSSPATGGPGRIGTRVVAELSKRGVNYGGLRSDFALTGQSLDALMGRKVIGAVAGFLGGLTVLSALRYAGGIGLPTFAPLAVAVVVAVALFIAPDIDVRKTATKRRREFTEQLSVYLDLVSLKMAGHAAAAAALPEAAQRGGGWPMMLIRDTLFRARLCGQDEWTALADLGQRIGVADLRELGALIKLVSDDGAQVRSTLTARAASMRRAHLADEEGNAEERNQSMRLAQMLIALGFMVFVGYPAFVNIQF
ncbi:type II secretion system protein [Jatrophihabitans sp. YIM 134969]